MKKLKIKTAKEKSDLLTRDQLQLIMGGDGAFGSCQEYGSPCDTANEINCCNNLVCVQELQDPGTKICKNATI